MARFALAHSDVLLLTRFTEMGSNFCVLVLARNFLCFGLGALFIFHKREQIFVFWFGRAFHFPQTRANLMVSFNFTLVSFLILDLVWFPQTCSNKTEVILFGISMGTDYCKRWFQLCPGSNVE